MNIAAWHSKYVRGYKILLPTTKRISLSESTKYFNIFSGEEEENFADHLINLLHSSQWQQRQNIIVICIGSDRSTGDSLGPITGSFLFDVLPPPFIVYGNLDNPVHALNLKDILAEIEEKYSDKLILAIDACLGSRDRIGFVELGLGQLFPGSILNKTLPPVGDIYINGIVNSGGYMDFMVLQSTRLGSVIPMARFIAQGVHSAISSCLTSVGCCHISRNILDCSPTILK